MGDAGMNENISRSGGQALELAKAYGREFLSLSRRLLANRGATIAAALLAALCATAVLAPWLSPHDPNFIDPVNRLKAPSSVYPMGTDGLGRDVMSRVIYGTRLSIQVSASVVFFTTIAGTILGLLAGYYRRVDNILMRVLDGLMAFPGIILNIGIMAALGPSVQNVIFALSFVYSPRMARVVRGACLVEKQKQYVEAARALGAGDLRIFGHILPNCVAPIIIQATMTFAYAVLAESSLSFLGVGVPPEIPSWGNILAQGRVFIMRAPWISLYSGLAIAVFVLSINMFGDGLRDILDPKLRR
jgi:peptide/nickel transport system permease protein